MDARDKPGHDNLFGVNEELLPYACSMRVGVDGVDDLGPQCDGQRVTHAFDHHELRAGDRGGGVLAAFGAHQRIDGAVDHQRRRLHLGEPFLSAAGGEDGAELTPDALGMQAAFEGSNGAFAVQRFVLRESSDPQELPGLRETLDEDWLVT